MSPTALHSERPTMPHAVAPTPHRPLQAVRRLLAALAGTLLAAGDSAAGGGPRPATPPERVEAIGALELVTHLRAQRGGDAAGFGWQHVAHWSLRRHGQPLVFEAPGGVFGDRSQPLTRINAVFVIERGAGLPDLLVHVGDAHNTSSFHLVRQQGEALQVRLLCIVSGGDNAVAWAQHLQRSGAGGAVERLPAALPGRTQWLQGPRLERLRADALDAGRYLMLGRRCLFDTVGGPVRWIPYDADGTSTLPWGPALVSPDGTRLARLGHAEAPGSPAGTDRRPLLLVAELLSLPDGVVPGSVAAHQAARQLGRERDLWQRIELPHTRMRFATLREVDVAWVLHHFRWQRDAQGERLVERRGFVALPHRGALSEASARYTVEGLKDGQRQRFVDFLVQRFDGRPLADGSGEFGVSVQVGAHVVTVDESGFHIAQPGRPAAPGQPQDPQVQRDAVRRLGEAFDAELASGRLDHLFADPAR